MWLDELVNTRAWNNLLEEPYLRLWLLTLQSSPKLGGANAFLSSYVHRQVG